MDWIKECYYSKMRPFRDRPDIEIAGRWHWCPPGAVTLPYLHLFGSFTQDYGEERLDPPVGEIPSRRGHSNGASSPRYTGKNWCGSEEVWTKGALYSALGTPAVDAEGVPFCCNALPPTPGGACAEGEAIWGPPFVGELLSGGIPDPAAVAGGGALLSGGPTHSATSGGTELLSGGVSDRLDLAGGGVLLSGGVNDEFAGGVVLVGGGVGDQLDQVGGGDLLSGGVNDAAAVAGGGVLLSGGETDDTAGGGALLSGGVIDAAAVADGGVLLSGGLVAVLHQVGGGALLSGGLVEVLHQVGGGALLSGGLVEAAAVAGGGVLLSGGATGDTVGGDEVVSGGIIDAAAVASGELVSGGIIDAAAVASGGVLLGGGLTDVADVAGGGGELVSGGATDNAAGTNEVLSGGLFNVAPAAGGGVLLSAGSFNVAPVAGGGVLLSAGAAGDTVGGGVLLSGGLLAAAPIVGGATCEEAVGISLDRVYETSVPVLSDRWFKFDYITSTDYRLVITPIEGDFDVMAIIIGGCDDPHIVASWPGGGCRGFVIAPASGQAWIAFSTTVPCSFTFKLELGACP